MILHLGYYKGLKIHVEHLPKSHYPDVSFPSSEHQTTVRNVMTMQPFLSLMRGFVVSQHSIGR